MQLDEVMAKAREHPEVDALTHAEAFADALDREGIVLLLAAHIDHVFRNEVRVIERAAFRRHVAALPPVASPQRDPAFRKLMVKRFALGNGERVSYGDATVEQHRARIAMLTKHRDGIQRDIDQHIIAIEMIEANGVKCLNDID